MDHNDLSLALTTVLFLIMCLSGLCAHVSTDAPGGAEESLGSFVVEPPEL